ncbi:hypothetical protein N431DRAFT_463104 [Stipitochalara longipes BDJ]|nr:hypothetical protein N431DRAFT_463104 [Stipitochalara longipes BDJ]
MPPPSEQPGPSNLEQQIQKEYSQSIKNICLRTNAINVQTNDLTITPLSPSAPAPSCVCTSGWEHGFFDCQARYRLPKDGWLCKEGQRGKAWSEILKGQTFCLVGLENAPETNAVYHALRQEKHVLIRFLGVWHDKVRKEWTALYQDEKREQEIVVLRGMELLNKIVTLLLQPENSTKVYGAVIDEEERKELGKLMFDLSGLEIREDGGVEGQPGLGYHDPEGCRCEYKDKEAQTVEKEEEKDRHDSGVGMEADQVMAMRDGEGTQIAGKGNGHEAESSSDDEDGGVKIGNNMEEIDVGDEKIGQQKEEGHARYDEKETASKKRSGFWHSFCETPYEG